MFGGHRYGRGTQHARSIPVCSRFSYLVHTPFRFSTSASFDLSQTTSRPLTHGTAAVCISQLILVPVTSRRVTLNTIRSHIHFDLTGSKPHHRSTLLSKDIFKMPDLDLRRRALESGKTTSRKAQAKSQQSSRASSRANSAVNSRAASRVVSRDVSDDEDDRNGNLSDDTNMRYEHESSSPKIRAG